MKDASLLISQYLHGGIDPAAQAELSAWIKADPRHAELFIRHAFVHSRLGSSLRGQAVVDQLDASSIPAKISSAIDAAHSHRHLRPIGVAALLLLVAGATFTLLRHWTLQPRAATVQMLLNAGWDGTSLVDGSNISSGSYHLRSGLARIDFAHGSQVILQGPASFAVSAERLELDSGKAVVACPTISSRSLVVETPDSRIVDLGTEYGVSVSPPATSCVQVFQGSVQSISKQSTDGQKTLVAGQTWPPSNQALSIPSSQFVRQGQLEMLSRAQSHSPCSASAAQLLQLLKDPSVIFCSDFNPLWDGRSTANLARPDDPWLQSLRPNPPLDFEPGRSPNDQSLAFNNLGQALRVNVPGRFRSLTFAAWIKLDSEPIGSQRHRGIVMPDGWGAIGEVHWQIKKRGIRLTIFDRGDDEDPRYSADCETLFDGNWHQCVSVIDTENGQTSGKVCHYIDGKLIYTRSIRRAMPTLTLGRCCVGNWVPSPDDLADDRTLGGRVDDLLIWNRPLNPEQVRSLFADAPLHNQPQN